MVGNGAQGVEVGLEDDGGVRNGGEVVLVLGRLVACGPFVGLESSPSGFVVLGDFDDLQQGGLGGLKVRGGRPGLEGGGSLDSASEL